MQNTLEKSLNLGFKIKVIAISKPLLPLQHNESLYFGLPVLRLVEVGCL